MKVSGFRAVGLFSFYSQLLFNQAVVSSYFHYHSFSVEDESVQSLLCLLPVMDSSGFLDSVASHSLFILPRAGILQHSAGISLFIFLLLELIRVPIVSMI